MYNVHSALYITSCQSRPCVKETTLKTSYKHLYVLLIPDMPSLACAVMIFLIKKVAELLINPAFLDKHNIGADYLGRALYILVFTDESKEIHTQELFLFIDRGIIDTNCNLPIIQNCEKFLYFQKYIR